jgi:hypothetical protein
MLLSKSFKHYLLKIKNSNSLGKQAIAVIFFLLLVSCSDPDKSTVSTASEKRLFLQVVDSILVDYFGRLVIMDASEDFKEFLAVNAKTDEVVIFNHEGKILDSFENQKDSPEAINDIFSMSFLPNNEILVAGSRVKLAIYDRKGKQKFKFKLPSLVARGSSLMQKSLFKTENNKFLGHIPAYHESAFSNGLLKPTLIFIDPEDESKTKALFKIPSNSKYSDGRFHGYVQAALNFSGNELFLVYQNEPKLHVYNYRNDDLIFNKTIDLGIPDFVEILPSSNEKSYNFDKNHRESTSGVIYRIFSNNKNIFLLYTKGIPESKFDKEIKTTREFIKSNPFYLVLLNDNLEILQNDIPVPLYITHDLHAVSNDGTFIGRKNPVFSDIEGEYEIFYTFKLNEKI